MDKILTVNDVAQVLQVKAITVREMFREKRLRGFKVGKSWRTTETMLKEDIDALARGESPAALPTPATAPTPAHAAPPGARADVGRDAHTAASDSPLKKNAPDKKSSPAPRRDRDSDDEDDTQQLLF